MRAKLRWVSTVTMLLACTSSSPRAPVAQPKTASGPPKPLIPPAFADVESWCARNASRPFVKCVTEVAALVMASPLAGSNPTWMKSGLHAAACVEGKSSIVCHEGARVTCTDGVVTDILACATMDMVCSPNAAGGGECVRAGCFPGPQMQCFAGFLDSCNETRSEMTRHRCPSNVPCQDDGAGSFTCNASSACDVTTCEGGVAQVCVAGVPRVVQCESTGWSCPAAGIPGLPPAPCALPTTGEACKGEQTSCEGATLRYCLNEHARTIDCASVGLGCVDDATLGAHCASSPAP